MRIHVAFGAELKGVLTYVAGSGSSRALSPFSSSIVASRIIALLYVPLLIVYRIRFDSAGEGSSVQTPRRNRRPSIPTRLKPATEPRIAQTVLTRGACRMIGCSAFQTYGCFATLNRHKKSSICKKKLIFAFTSVSAAPVRQSKRCYQGSIISSAEPSHAVRMVASAALWRRQALDNSRACEVRLMPTVEQLDAAE